jgi:hypothetical protein
MLFLGIALAFVAVVVTCLVIINRWMVSGRPQDMGDDDDLQ